MNLQTDCEFETRTLVSFGRINTFDAFLQSILKQRFHDNPLFSFGYNNL